MKKIKFSDILINKVLSGEKTTTWRLFDDKNLTARDELLLCDAAGKDFARSRIITIKEKTLSEITIKEKEESGWEEETNKEITEHYSKLYKKPVDKNTKIKIIKFKLL